MSYTPRTDEIAKREFVPDGLWIKHARELEAELAAERARLDWLERNWVNWPLGNVVDTIRAGIDAAMKEAQP